MFSSHFLFPPDFFEPINPKEKAFKSPEKKINQNKDTFMYKPKSIYIDITNEDEEDKELLLMLEGKRRFLFIIFISFINI